MNYLLRGWIKNLETKGSVGLPLLDDTQTIEDSIAKELEFIREGSKKSVSVKFYGSKFTLWKKIGTYIKSRFGKVEVKSSLVD